MKKLIRVSPDLVKRYNYIEPKDCPVFHALKKAGVNVESVVPYGYSYFTSRGKLKDVYMNLRSSIVCTGKFRFWHNTNSRRKDDSLQD